MFTYVHAHARTCMNYTVMNMSAHVQGTVCACSRSHAIQENTFVIRTYHHIGTSPKCKHHICEALEHVPSHIPTFTKLKRVPWHAQHRYFTPNDAVGMPRACLSWKLEKTQYSHIPDDPLENRQKSLKIQCSPGASLLIWTSRK